LLTAAWSIDDQCERCRVSATGNIAKELALTPITTVIYSPANDFGGVLWATRSRFRMPNGK
jgi:hypothetical protein